MRLARSRRRSMSKPEAMLWRLLRGTPSGIRFRRQYAVGTYVADFYCPRAKLVIEIDGLVHESRLDQGPSTSFAGPPPHEASPRREDI
ncbi:MAG TPA: DUF559 domain-containing protein [Sphingomicrobium sp.]|nr:DUF559 domain-containing protein [Sphingomicrobium sp.]